VRASVADESQGTAGNSDPEIHDELTYVRRSLHASAKADPRPPFTEQV
jgi:hypothetical protein